MFMAPQSDWKMTKSWAEVNDYKHWKSTSTISNKDDDLALGNYFFTQAQGKNNLITMQLIEDEEAFIISDSSNNYWAKSGKKVRPKYKSIKHKRAPSSEERKSGKAWKSSVNSDRKQGRYHKWGDKHTTQDSFEKKACWSMPKWDDKTSHTWRSWAGNRVWMEANPSHEPEFIQLDGHLQYGTRHMKA